MGPSFTVLKHEILSTPEGYKSGTRNNIARTLITETSTFSPSPRPVYFLRSAYISHGCFSGWFWFFEAQTWAKVSGGEGGSPLSPPTARVRCCPGVGPARRPAALPPLPPPAPRRGKAGRRPEAGEAPVPAPCRSPPAPLPLRLTAARGRRQTFARPRLRRARGAEGAAPRRAAPPASPGEP